MAFSKQREGLILCKSDFKYVNTYCILSDQDYNHCLHS
jgi:hypothetical protein